MQITFVQTADAFRYYDMLAVTARTVIEYCRRHDHAYESFVGVKRGFWPWQATYNRIVQLQELLDRGVGGWAAYLDADAYVYDLDFDLAGYLATRAHNSAVMIPSMATQHHWDINAGVMLINLGHPLGQRFVRRYSAMFAAVSDERLRKAQDWLESDNDQHFVQLMLIEDAEFSASIHYASPSLMNSDHASFIRQHLRGLTPDLNERIRILREVTDKVLGRSQADRQGEVIAALYRELLGRDPDEGGLRDYRNFFEGSTFDEAVARVARSLAASEEARGRAG